MKTVYVTEEVVQRKQIKIMHDQANGKFVVCYFANGKHMDASDDVVDTRDEAVSLANHFIEQEKNYWEE